MIFALIGALLIGLTLGLLGSGGSILTVPVLVYLVGEPDKLAIAESLGIVTLVSLAGMIPFALRRQVDWRSVVAFGAPGMVGSYAGAYLSTYVPGHVQLLLFAAILLVAALVMFTRPMASPTPAHSPVWQMMLEGLFIGGLAGLIGVGGGFLIVPSLVLLCGLSMTVAIGTSLAIIVLNSASGLYKYADVLADAGLSMNWNVMIVFAAIGIVGSLLGTRVGDHLSQPLLRRSFAVFLVLTSAFIVLQNVV